MAVFVISKETGFGCETFKHVIYVQCKGPRIEPWGTPAFRTNYDVVPPTTLDCQRRSSVSTCLSIDVSCDVVVLQFEHKKAVTDFIKSIGEV